MVEGSSADQTQDSHDSASAWVYPAVRPRLSLRNKISPVTSQTSSALRATRRRSGDKPPQQPKGIQASRRAKGRPSRRVTTNLAPKQQQRPLPPSSSLLVAGQSPATLSCTGSTTKNRGGQLRRSTKETMAPKNLLEKAGRDSSSQQQISNSNALRQEISKLERAANSIIEEQNGRIERLRSTVSALARGHSNDLDRRRVAAAFFRWQRYAALSIVSVLPYVREGDTGLDLSRLSSLSHKAEGCSSSITADSCSLTGETRVEVSSCCSSECQNLLPERTASQGRSRRTWGSLGSEGSITIAPAKHGQAAQSTAPVRQLRGRFCKQDLPARSGGPWEGQTLAGQAHSARASPSAATQPSPRGVNSSAQEARLKGGAPTISKASCSRRRCCIHRPGNKTQQPPTERQPAAQACDLDGSAGQGILYDMVGSTAREQCSVLI